MLALAEIQQGHDGGLFVLLGVSLEDFGNDRLALLVESEGDVGVVVCGVAVLDPFMLVLLVFSTLLISVFQRVPVPGPGLTDSLENL